MELIIFMAIMGFPCGKDLQIGEFSHAYVNWVVGIQQYLVNMEHCIKNQRICDQQRLDFNQSRFYHVLSP